MTAPFIRPDVSDLVLRTYGLGLFVASPFIVGCVTGYLGNRAADIGWWDTVRLVLGAGFLGCVALLAVAVEGIICLVMAAPLILVMAWVGGLVGRAIAIRRPGAASAFFASRSISSMRWPRIWPSVAPSR